ncbi:MULTISPECIES: DUF6328 family protein [Glutamicibacter]|uniref:DUF6328 family protein n=1 Tax=Glutamicibacter halophytocola TaxID=1933880 RepID=A0A5B8IVX3_9MICC|nr:MULTISPECIES: DUF6328 family protein [Glutamicibacter]ALG29998.1 hypothetical protein AOZ07_14100 [Glutamicibacter halophytocola]MBF6670841.1 hypothetical protein [Glutamicibacter sp. FBE19]QDY66267.1 hypothetical protein FQA45_08025 [Glutamicibacter halophytocola]UUX58368.1 DUF6328 family protein [Glutamicibacter halophytocola]
MNTRSHPDTSDGAAHRQWNELLQEMRVMQTGVQILAAFLVVLPFQARFEMLSRSDETIYIVLLVAATLLILLLITPVAVHRYFFGQRLKEQTVALGHIVLKIVGVGVGLLVSGCVWFVLQVLFGWQLGAWIGGGLVLATLFLLLALPRILLPARARDAG